MAEDKKPSRKVTNNPNITVRKKNVAADFINDFANDVLFPKAKGAAADLMDGLIDNLGDAIKDAIFGKSFNEERISKNRKSSTSYQSFYENRQKYYRNRRKNDFGSIRGSGYSFQIIEFEDYEEAQECLEQMLDWLETYGYISVLRYYDIVGGCEGIMRNIDEKHGWTELDGVKVIRDHGKWIIDLPKAHPEPV